MANRKNVLLIMTDQQRWDTLGCYGAPTCKTPNLDALASRGVKFDAAYTPTSPCSPARAALFGGVYGHKDGVPRNGGFFRQDITNLAELLKPAGYKLGYAGKWHVDQGHVPTEYGFEGKDFPGYGYPPTHGFVEGLKYMQSYDMPNHYEVYLKDHGLEVPKVVEATYGANPGKANQEMYALQSGTLEQSFECMVTEFTNELLEKFAAEGKQDGEPFFIWSNFWGPHTPCFVPEPYYSMYNPEDIPEEPNFCETWQNKPFVHDLVERLWGLREGGWEGWREIVARYWGYCTMIDDLVGMMTAKLEELDLLEDTMVVFTTDHGDQMGAHRLLEKGCFGYEETWRLPLIATHPDCENPGSVSDEFVYLFDLMPTVLEMAGVDIPDEIDAQSILPNILGRDEPTGRDHVYCEFAGHLFPSSFRMVRNRRYKLIWNQTQISELYDLKHDPYELNNIIDLPEVEAVKRKLLDVMREDMVRTEDPALRPFDTIRHML